jgi:hypothetical protein
MSELINVQTFKYVLSRFCFSPLETVQIHKGCCQTQSESADDVRGQSKSECIGFVHSCCALGLCFGSNALDSGGDLRFLV